MQRMGCPDVNITMNPLGYSQVLGGSTIKPYTCACGLLTFPSGRVGEVIVDKMNEVVLMEMPIFADPLFLSVELSIAMVIIVGKLGSVAAIALGLPSVIGFLLAGVSIQVKSLPIPRTSNNGI